MATKWERRAKELWDDWCDGSFNDPGSHVGTAVWAYAMCLAYAEANKSKQAAEWGQIAKAALCLDWIVHEHSMFPPADV